MILNILIVFSITLILTKSRILAEKREFVDLRYESSKIEGQRPGRIHRIWHAIWTCPMCSGFWVAIPVCWIYPVYGLLPDVLFVFGANWLVHCVENVLFFAGKISESIDDKNIPSLLVKFFKKELTNKKNNV